MWEIIHIHSRVSPQKYPPWNCGVRLKQVWQHHQVKGRVLQRQVSDADRRVEEFERKKLEYELVSIAVAPSKVQEQD